MSKKFLPIIMAVLCIIIVMIIRIFEKIPLIVIIPIICIIIATGVIYFARENDQYQDTKPDNCKSPLKIPRILRQDKNTKLLNVPPRRMWGWGGWNNTMLGYCGESSVQISAVYYGNYFSQEQILKAAGGSLMLGINDNICFPNLHLNWELWPSAENSPPNVPDPSIYDILNYIKSQIDKNCPVIAALYVNEPAGDPSFDHQCVFSGYDLDYNGAISNLWLLDTYEIRIMPFDCKLAPYECLSDPKKCNKINPPPLEGNNIYPAQPFPICYKRRVDFQNPNQQAPYNVAIPNILANDDPVTGQPLVSAFASVKGNVDPNNELFPCWLEMNSVFEPNWGSEDQLYATPIPISCKVYIEGLTKGGKYSLLRFDNPADVPTKGNFINSKGYTMRVDFTACGNTNMIHVTHNDKVWPFMSNGTYFFRCVETKGVPPKQNFPFGTNRTDTSLGPIPNSNSIEMTLSHPTRRPGPGTSYINRMNTRYMNMRNPRKRVKPPRNVKKSNSSPTVNSRISCGNKGIGYINPVWEWKFTSGKFYDGTKGYGSFTVLFTVQDHGSEAANCVNFTINNNDDDGPDLDDDSVTGVIIYDVDGTKPRLYIEDFGNSFTYVFSPNPQNSDGSFTMLSQDGVTYSTLRPIASS